MSTFLKAGKALNAWLNKKAFVYAILCPIHVEGGRQNLRQLNCSFTTIFSQFFAIYINIFQKTEVQSVILRC